jgi:hypothetical protein
VLEPRSRTSNDYHCFSPFACERLSGTKVVGMKSSG